MRFSSDVLYGVAFQHVNSEVSPEESQLAAQSLAAWVAAEHESEKWMGVPALVAESALTVLTREPPPLGVDPDPRWTAELLRLRRVTGRQAADEAALSALEERLRTGSSSAVLVVATAEALFDAGQTQRGFDALQNELDRLTDRYGAGAPATFPTLQNLAIAWAAQARNHSGNPEAGGIFHHAISLYRQLLAGREQQGKAGDRRIPDTRMDLARLLRDANQYQDAVMEGQQAIQEMQRCADYGPDHPDTLSARNNLAIWTGEAGNAARARDLLAALLQDRVRVLGPNHPNTLITRGNLATWTGTSGNTAGAKDLQAALLRDEIRILGPDHPNTLITRNNLATSTGESRDWAGARDLFAALLRDQVRILGPDHPNTLITRNNLALTTGRAGNTAGARDLFAALLDDQVRILGADHPDTLRSRNNLAAMTGRTGNTAGARDLFAALLRDEVRILGPNHPHTLITRNNFADFTGKAGDPAGARDLFAALLPDQVRRLGPDHPNTLTSRKALAFWTGEAGDALR